MITTIAIVPCRLSSARLIQITAAVSRLSLVKSCLEGDFNDNIGNVQHTVIMKKKTFLLSITFDHIKAYIRSHYKAFVYSIVAMQNLISIGFRVWFDC